MAIRHSTRRRPSGRARSSTTHLSKPTPVGSSASTTRPDRKVVAKNKKKVAKPADLDEILGQFAEARALIETAHSALEQAKEFEWVGRAIGAAVVTLDRGMAELGRAYTALDLAILRKAGAS